MKLSERFDRRYQQTPLAVPVPPGGAPAPATQPPMPQAPTPAAPSPATLASTQVVAAPAPPAPVVQLTPTLAAAKNEIHAQMLAHHTAQIDINNRAGIRRLLQQLTEEHFRGKPNLGVTSADRERLVEALFD